MKARRNVLDYERLPQHSEAHLTWALITLMTRRLIRRGPRKDWSKKTDPLRQPRLKDGPDPTLSFNHGAGSRPTRSLLSAAQTVDSGQHVLDMRKYLGLQLIAPRIVLVMAREIQVPCVLQDRAVLRGQKGESPVGSGILRFELAGGESGPNACEGQQDIAGVRIQLGQEFGDARDARLDEVGMRHQVEHLGRPRARQGAVTRQDHSDHQGQVRHWTSLRNPARHELLTQPLAKEEVPRRREPPRPDLGLDNDDEFDRPDSGGQAGDLQEPLQQ
ncbi:hypothetical protein DDE74_39255 [Streptomyces lydicus]|uniref:Uncharacterized protein n=1 Tax=Streptomyces lydicus TaxID=47763 RepID=A0A3Q9KAZ4_9ACTN|nr:hypothetical protein DDE74_39255 [Streptomyces lydicus]